MLWEENGYFDDVGCVRVRVLWQQGVSQNIVTDLVWREYVEHAHYTMYNHVICYTTKQLAIVKGEFVNDKHVEGELVKGYRWIEGVSLIFEGLKEHGICYGMEWNV